MPAGWTTELLAKVAQFVCTWTDQDGWNQSWSSTVYDEMPALVWC